MSIQALEFSLLRADFSTFVNAIENHVDSVDTELLD